MKDKSKTKAQLIVELQAAQEQATNLASRLSELESANKRLEQAMAKYRQTEEKFQQASAKQQNLLRTLIDNLPDYVYAKDTESRFILGNRACIRDLGAKTEQEILGKTDFDFLPTELAEYYYATEQELLKSGQPMINREENALNGRWLLTTKIPLKDKQGVIVGLVGMSRDISELKQIQDAMTISREILQRLVDQLPIGIQVFDPNGLCVNVNKAHLNIFGVVQPEQLVGAYNLFEDKMAAQTGTQAAALRALEGQIVHLPEVFFDFATHSDPRFAQTHGHRILAVTFFPVRGANGDIVQIVALNEDITERRQLEDQLHQAQKMEAVGQLAGGVAHNFNNMLTAMMGYTGLVLDMLPVEHPAFKDIQGIQRITRRAADLTQQLLAFTRRQVIRPRILDVNEAILGMNSLLRQLISESIDLVMKPGQDLGQVKIDPGQLEQILVNLVVNARDAMPNGGKITVETSNKRLDQSYAEQHAEVSPGDYVLLAVSDTGAGMTDEVKGRVFEPFFTTKNVGQGTGLGLSTCFGIVKQNKGHLTVYSELERGSTFKVYLPRISDEPEVFSKSDETDAMPRGIEMILVVEDEAVVREMAARILRQQGYTVITAADGPTALQFVKGQPDLAIHLLITDVVLPKMTGTVLADQLKIYRPEIKVLFISGYTDNTIVHHGVLEPGILFLPKPFTPEALARKVRDVLDDRDEAIN